MATIANDGTRVLDGDAAERRFFLILAIIMTLGIVGGFSLNLGMGRSTFAVPPIFHVHAFVFFAWVALFLAQNVLIARNKPALHRRLGWIAVGWVPLMVVAGTWLAFTVLQRTGGPFFFAKNAFLFSNVAHLLTFAGLTLVGLKQRRYTGWHRRFMLTGMAILSGPGFGRLVPLPLLIPYAWHVMLGVVLLFPVAGMIRDKLRHGRVHPAWFWAIGALLVAQVIADIAAHSAWGIGLTETLTAGTPGAERPMQAFLPPGFTL